MSKLTNHAIVYGASGLIGWALVNELLRPYPHDGSFSKVTAVTNRPLKSKTYWPESGSQRPNLQCVSGIDLRDGDVTAFANIQNIETVTHIFYFVFTAVDDDIEEVATNRRMFESVINAHNSLSPDLQFVVFPGGTRGYGIYAPGGTFTPPLREEMVKDLSPEQEKTVVYPAYRKLLNEASQGKKWTWCEICPDAIIGFTPNGSQYSLALHWAQYLSLYAYKHGKGPEIQDSRALSAEIPFPGNTVCANSMFSPVSSGKLAQFAIYASLHPEACGGGKLFNIADNDVPCTYGELWPRIAAWFGLVGVGPIEEAEHSALKVGELPEDRSMTPGEYILKYRDIFSRHGRPNALSGGVGVGSRQLDSVGYWLSFDRQLSLERLMETMFIENRDPAQGWIESFEMFRKAGLIL